MSYYVILKDSAAWTIASGTEENLILKQTRDERKQSAVIFGPFRNPEDAQARLARTVQLHGQCNVELVVTAPWSVEVTANATAQARFVYPETEEKEEIDV